MVGKNIRNYIQYFLCFPNVYFFHCIYLACVVILCVFVYLICICCTLCVFVYLICICCTLCVFVVLCVYCCSYFRCQTAGQKSVPGRSCEQPPRHRVFLFSLCLQANTEMVPKIPSCYYMFLVQPSRLKFSSPFFGICVHVK